MPCERGSDELDFFDARASYRKLGKRDTVVVHVSFASESEVAIPLRFRELRVVRNSAPFS